MAKWRVDHSWPAGVTPDSDRDAAFAFTLSTEGEEGRQTTVEYAAPSQLASMSHARNALEQWLDDDRPPRRLLVDREGNVRPLPEQAPFERVRVVAEDDAGRPRQAVVTMPAVGLEFGRRFYVLGDSLRVGEPGFAWTGEPTGARPNTITAPKRNVRDPVPIDA